MNDSVAGIVVEAYRQLSLEQLKNGYDNAKIQDNKYVDRLHDLTIIVLQNECDNKVSARESAQHNHTRSMLTILVDYAKMLIDTLMRLAPAETTRRF